MTDRLPPCGHSNGTHPSGCWYVAVCDAVAAERARIRTAVEMMPSGAPLDAPFNALVYRAAVLAIIEGREP